MDKFILHSEYKPTGDQPQAAQLYGEFKEFFSENAVEHFVSYLRTRWSQKG